MKLSPLVQREIKRLDDRIAVAHRRISCDKNVDDEAEVIDRLTPIIQAMEKTNSLQEFVKRPLSQPQRPQKTQKKAQSAAQPTEAEKKAAKPNKAKHPSN